MTAGVQRPAPKIGRLARLKLTEPVRLYVYALQLAAGIVVLIAAAVNSGTALMFALPTVLMFWFSAIFGTEAARASTYSPAGMMRALKEAFENR